MAHRLEVVPTVPDARGLVRQEQLTALVFPVQEVRVVDVYTIDAPLSLNAQQKIQELFTNPVVQRTSIDAPAVYDRFDNAFEVGFLPGVTDNIGVTARESIEDRLKIRLDGPGVYSSQLLLVKGNLSKEQREQLVQHLANPLIQRVHVKSFEEYARTQGMEITVPRVHLTGTPRADLIDILGASDEELTRIGKEGIANPDGLSRGPLALDITYMKTLQQHFRSIRRNPYDIELESLAQTWSEHCKHTIFADPIDEIKEGLFKHYIRRATEEIRARKGSKDFCVSVFTDNSGAIAFDDAFLITDKVETHNSPSALDPFGGSITGIGGVNRDAIGFGLGAKPIANGYGFCLADPHVDVPLYRGKSKTQPLLPAREIMEGVIRGVEVGGNCSGIPTPQGFLYFDERFRGKPLVFVRTVGLIPREHDGRKLYEKRAQPGDYIVMMGGCVGKDGIHGATFSSEALDTGSPATAVQIGDPITQKKLSDVITKEARDLGFYTSITDNGAGGLSCSVAEMAKESGGFRVDLDRVPLKYPGLQPWEIWISESQERMTLSVPPEKWGAFSDLMRRRGVEAAVIGEFTGSGKCIVEYRGECVMDISMDFLHHGLPPRPMQTTFTLKRHEEPDFVCPDNLTSSLEQMLGRLNIASTAFVSQRYDHEVQGSSVLKPLQGRGLVNADATILRPVLSSRKGIVLSHGINPNYSDIDTYQMAANAIDTAIRNAVAAGAPLDCIALLDNFCWCSSNEPERLGQLKRAAQACYEYAIAYGTPFISGKDSMFNDFKGYDTDGNPVKISIPPALLVSSLGVMDDASKAISLDAKMPGDLVYVVGSTHDELGGSEYFSMIGEQERGKAYIGNRVPQVSSTINFLTYQCLEQTIDRELVASAQSVHRGGLGIALAKSAMGGMLGMDISLEGFLGSVTRDDYALYSESPGRIVVTVNPRHQKSFEECIEPAVYAFIGTVRSDEQFTIRGITGKEVVRTTLDTLQHAYRATFANF